MERRTQMKRLLTTKYMDAVDCSVYYANIQGLGRNSRGY